MARQASLGVLLSLVFAAAACAQSAALLPEPLLARHGLKRGWFTQIETERVHGRLAHLTQHVSAAKAYAVEEIEVDGRVIAFSEREVNRYGVPLGKEGALALAKRKLEELKADGKQPKHETRVYPDVILMAVSERGVLQVLDGETGRTKWVLNIGDPLHPSTAAGANDSYVAVCHGSSLYVYDRESGRLAWQRALGGAPGAGPALGHELVYVPLIKGRLEGYRLDKPETPPWIFSASGRCLTQPTVTPYVMSFMTDRGYLYVGLLDQATVKYKFEAHDAVMEGALHADPRASFLASIDGYVYSVDEPTGNEKWRFSTGEPIIHSPVPIQGAVYAVCDRAGMYSIDAESGQEIWWTPQVKQFVAGSKNRVYVIGENRRLTIIDAKTGGRVGTLPTEEIDLVYTNSLTDRIYLATRSGLLQCIHEAPQTRPLAHVLPLEKGKTPLTPKPMMPMEGDPMMPMPAPGGNPFDMPMPAADPFADPPAGGAPAPAPAPPVANPPPADPFGM